MTRDEAIAWMVSNPGKVIKGDEYTNLYRYRDGLFECDLNYHPQRWTRTDVSGLYDGATFTPVDSPEDEKQKCRDKRIERIERLERAWNAQGVRPAAEVMHELLEEMIREALEE